MCPKIQGPSQELTWVVNVSVLKLPNLPCHRCTRGKHIATWFSSMNPSHSQMVTRRVWIAVGQRWWLWISASRPTLSNPILLRLLALLWSVSSFLSLIRSAWGMMFSIPRSPLPQHSASLSTSIAAILGRDSHTCVLQSLPLLCAVPLQLDHLRALTLCTALSDGVVETVRSANEQTNNKTMGTWRWAPGCVYPHLTLHGNIR